MEDYAVDTVEQEKMSDGKMAWRLWKVTKMEVNVNMKMKKVMKDVRTPKEVNSGGMCGEIVKRANGEEPGRPNRPLPGQRATEVEALDAKVPGHSGNAKCECTAAVVRVEGGEGDLRTLTTA
eukprot:16451393-Heterocapsa_arctica.AAC.2